MTTWSEMSLSEHIQLGTLAALALTLIIYGVLAYLTWRMIRFQAYGTFLSLVKETRETREARVRLSEMTMSGGGELDEAEKVALEATGFLDAMASLAMRDGFFGRLVGEVMGPLVEDTWRQAAPHIGTAEKKLRFRQGVLRGDLRELADRIRRSGSRLANE